jgi:hypothetical protein
MIAPLPEFSIIIEIVPKIPALLTSLAASTPSSAPSPARHC